MGQPAENAGPSGDAMTKKPGRRKSSNSLQNPLAIDGAPDNSGESLGAGLDEVGFKPLGRRIIVGRRTVATDHSGGTPSLVDVTPPDDPLG